MSISEEPDFSQLDDSALISMREEIAANWNASRRAPATTRNSPRGTT